MPTGTGKTKTTMHILVHYYTFCLKNRGSIVWLAHTTELLQQAYDTFSEVWQHLGNGQVTAYKIWGNKDISFLNSTTNGILFCTPWGIPDWQIAQKSTPYPACWLGKYGSKMPEKRLPEAKIYQSCYKNIPSSPKCILKRIFWCP